MKAFVLVLVLFFLVWDLAWWAAGVAPKTPWALRRELAESKPPLLLDVRTPAEFALFHLPGAVNRPEVLVDGAYLESLARDREVVVVCMTGHRSPFVVRKMQGMGFSNVSNLTWGSLGWLLTGGAVERGG